MADRYRYLRIFAAGIGLAALSFFGSVARADIRILITLEWPPYTGIHEPGGGTVTTLVNKVFKAMGDTTRVGYFPWRRVLELPRTDRRFAASYPMYYSQERAQRCYFSDPIGEGPVGLAELKDHPLAWKSVTDLEQYTLGVVKGYVNTPEFDGLMGKGEIKVIAGDSDSENLHNLLDGKVQAVVIDENTFHYMSAHDPEFGGLENHAEMNPQLLVINRVYMCFPKDSAGLALRDRFNKALRTFEAPLPGHTDDAVPAQPAASAPPAKHHRRKATSSH